jgi:hypothetical protein
MTFKEEVLRRSLGPAMAMVESWTKEITPKNEIAEWMDQNLGILFDLPPGEELELGGVAPLLTKIAVAEANERPDFVEGKLLRFYEAFRIYYREKVQVVQEAPKI